MHMNRSIQYVILDKDYAIVKYHNISEKMIFLKSILRVKIKYQFTNFLLTKSDNISDFEFNSYIDSLREDCSIQESKNGKVILKANDQF